MTPELRTGWLGIVLAIFPFLSTAGCCAFLTTTTQSVALPDSQWKVITQECSTSALDSGVVEIFAEDAESNQRITLLFLIHIDDTHVEYLGDHRVQISLNNLSEIESQAFSFGPYEVTYRYLPIDDPEARANFQNWYKNPHDPISDKRHKGLIEK